jgi:hemerythrin-like domain-containing protein
LEVRDVSTRVARYFSESLPLHVADEEESILPRLSGRQPTLDAVLQTMHSQHAEHKPLLESLLDICDTLKASPEQLPHLRQSLHDVASKLRECFNAHLSDDENIVLPAIRSLLSAEERETLVTELRERRRVGVPG